eukprot:COSAG01_NODE_37385_length_504_cov_0.948148_1_plen_38_part_10
MSGSIVVLMLRDPDVVRLVSSALRLAAPKSACSCSLMP